MKLGTEQNAVAREGYSFVPGCRLPNPLTAVVAAILALACVTTSGAEEKKIAIPAGAALLVKLDQTVSSSDKPGTKFRGVLQGDLVGDGVEAGQEQQRCHWRSHGRQESQARAGQAMNRELIWRDMRCN